MPSPGTGTPPVSANSSDRTRAPTPGSSASSLGSSQPVLHAMSRIELALRGCGRVGRDGVDPSAVGREAEHAAHHVVIGTRQVVVRDADLAVREPLPEQRVLHFHAHAAWRQREQIRKRIQRELEPRHPRHLRPSGAPTPVAQRRQMLVDCRSAAVTGRAHAANDDLAELLAMDLEQGPERCVRRIGVAVPLAPVAVVSEEPQERPLVDRRSSSIPP